MINSPVFWVLHSEGQCIPDTLRIAHPRIGHLGGNPEVGNPESISHQDCPPQLLSFSMNCLRLIWALGEYWGHGQCIQSQYFEEQSNLCNLRRYFKAHSGEKSNEYNQMACQGWCTDASSRAGHLRTRLGTHSEEEKCNQCDFVSNQAGHLRRRF